MSCKIMPYLYGAPRPARRGHGLLTHSLYASSENGIDAWIEAAQHGCKILDYQLSVKDGCRPWQLRCNKRVTKTNTHTHTCEDATKSVNASATKPCRGMATQVDLVGEVGL